ncbi:MAG: hypothetical protein HZA54_12940 [Planctomycetes bacterium]|nr:hypothetical protein [Planctomycetota bacterium]
MRIADPRPTDLSTAERHLALALGVQTVVFAGAFVVFAWFAHPLLQFINTVSLALVPGSSPIPDNPERFWFALALSMMAMITYIGAVGWWNVRRYLPLVPVLLLSKFFSSAVGVSLSITQWCPAYLSIPFSDFPIFLITWVLYRRVLRGQRGSSAANAG